MANLVFIVVGTAAVVVAGATGWMPSLQSVQRELSDQQWLAKAQLGGTGTRISAPAPTAPAGLTQTMVAGQP